MARFISAAIAALLLGACAASSLLPDEIEMSAGELNRQLEKRFPITREAAGGAVAFEFSRPEVTLGPATNRLVFALDIAVKSPALALLAGRPIVARAAISGVPRYDPGKLGLFLGEVRIDSVEGLSSSEARLISPALAFAGEIPIHTFRPGDFTRYGIRYEPQSIEVRDGRLLLRLAKAG